MAVAIAPAADGNGLPLTIYASSASLHEVTLVRKTLVERFTDEAPERLFAWLQDYRRILVRYEYHDENYLGFVHLGCILVLLKVYF